MGLMPKMIVHNKVQDFGNWKTVFDSMQSLRKQFGATDEQVFQKYDNPNDVVIITNWSNAEQARKYGQSQELKDGMQKAGVVGVPEVSFAD
jgi:heme-degrading monooxygenase HmoA